MPGAWHRWAAAVLMGVALLLGLARAAAAQQPPEGARPAEAELIDRCSPVIAIRAADGECDTDGELYGPVPVEAVLGNPRVQLVRPEGQRPAAPAGGEVAHCD